MNTRGSRGNDRELQWYLRSEYLGGTTLAALMREPRLRKYRGVRPGLSQIIRRPPGIRTSTGDRVRAAIVRIVTTAMVYLRRVKRVPVDQEV